MTWDSLLAGMILAWGLGGCATAGAPPADGSPTSPQQQTNVLRFDPAQAEVVAVAEPWVLWKNEQIDPATRESRAPAYISRYNIQKLGDAKSLLVYEHRGTSHPQLGTILEDGTIILEWHSELLWAKLGAMIRRESAELKSRPAAVLAIYADGAILQPARYGANVDRLAPLFWVPFKDQHLDYRSKQQLTDDVGMVGGHQPGFVRNGDRIVWIDGSRNDEFLPVAMRKPPLLYCFDTTRQSLAKVELPGEKFGTGRPVLAFDGKTAVTDSFLIDVTTGRLTEAPPVVALGMFNGRIYGLRNLETGTELVAISVDRPESRSLVHHFPTDAARVLSKWIDERGPGWTLNNLVIVGKDKIWVWDKTRWAKVEPKH